MPISGKRKFSEPWMSKGIDVSLRKRLSLNREPLQSGATNMAIAKYKEYCNNFNRVKRLARIKYYHNKAEMYETNTKKLWQLINATINKTKNSGSIIPNITVNGLKVYSANTIANKFGKFHSNVGANLATKITPSATTMDNYIVRIPRTVDSLFMKRTDCKEIKKTISELQNQTSCGHDQISNNLLKRVSSSISYPLEIIFNQLIAQGVFPNLMKVAEVIPLYKGKDHDEIINYRPISLLITVSKLLEKIVYKRV